MFEARRRPSSEASGPAESPCSVTVIAITMNMSARSSVPPATPWRSSADANTVATAAATIPRGPIHEMNSLSRHASPAPMLDSQTTAGRTTTISAATTSSARGPIAATSAMRTSAASNTNNRPINSVVSCSLNSASSSIRWMRRLPTTRPAAIDAEMPDSGTIAWLSW